jgi:hypothetical protein
LKQKLHVFLGPIAENAAHRAHFLQPLAKMLAQLRGQAAGNSYGLLEYMQQSVNIAFNDAHIGTKRTGLFAVKYQQLGQTSGISNRLLVTDIACLALLTDVL